MRHHPHGIHATRWRLLLPAMPMPMPGQQLDIVNLVRGESSAASTGWRPAPADALSARQRAAGGVALGTNRRGAARCAWIELNGYGHRRVASRASKRLFALMRVPTYTKIA
jgi:hypothetical protein